MDLEGIRLSERSHTDKRQIPYDLTDMEISYRHIQTQRTHIDTENRLMVARGRGGGGGVSCKINKSGDIIIN